MSVHPFTECDRWKSLIVYHDANPPNDLQMCSKTLKDIFYILTEYSLILKSNLADEASQYKGQIERILTHLQDCMHDWTFHPHFRKMHRMLTYAWFSFYSPHTLMKCSLTEHNNYVDFPTACFIPCITRQQLAQARDRIIFIDSDLPKDFFLALQKEGCLTDLLRLAYCVHVGNTEGFSFLFSDFLSRNYDAATLLLCLDEPLSNFLSIEVYLVVVEYALRHQLATVEDAYVGIVYSHLSKDPSKIAFSWLNFRAMHLPPLLSVLTQQIVNWVQNSSDALSALQAFSSNWVLMFTEHYSSGELKLLAPLAPKVLAFENCHFKETDLSCLLFFNQTSYLAFYNIEFPFAWCKYFSSSVTRLVIENNCSADYHTFSLFAPRSLQALILRRIPRELSSMMPEHCFPQLGILEIADCLCGDGTFNRALSYLNNLKHLTLGKMQIVNELGMCLPHSITQIHIYECPFINEQFLLFLKRGAPLLEKIELKATQIQMTSQLPESLPFAVIGDWPIMPFSIQSLINPYKMEI